MNLLSNDTLEILIETRAEACISIYLPTHKIGQQTQQNPIRLKNLVSKAEDHLKKLNIRQPAIDTILDPARDLIDQRPFWQHQSHGLAIFLWDGKVSIHLLPLEFEERVVVGNRFHLKPLLPLLSGDGRYYLLRLDLDEPLLFQASRYSMDSLEVNAMPEGMEAALRFDDPEKQLQHQTTTRTAGGHDAIYHGHGNGYDKKENILRYFHMLDAAVQKALADDNAPLILAGINYLLPIYQEANGYPHLLPEGVGMDVTTMQLNDLHQRAWEIMKPHFQKEQEEARSSYFVAREEGQTSQDLKEIVPGAYYGRVGILFVALDEQCPGIYNKEDNTVTLTEETEESQDMLDYAAVHTLRKGGSVYAVEADQVPGGGMAAAVLRY